MKFVSLLFSFFLLIQSPSQAVRSVTFEWTAGSPATGAPVTGFRLYVEPVLDSGVFEVLADVPVDGAPSLLPIRKTVADFPDQTRRVFVVAYAGNLESLPSNIVTVDQVAVGVRPASPSLKHVITITIQSP